MSAHSIHLTVKLFLRISILLLILLSLGLVSLWGQKESVKTGLWSEADTWSPPGVPSTSDAVTIKPGHLVTINSGVNVGVLTVEGTLEVLSSSVTFGANSQVTPTGIYRHGVDGGTVGGSAPANITWALGSTLEVTGVTTEETITAAQSYHHVVWNCVGQTSTLVFNNNFQNILGNLDFQHTGPSGRVVFRGNSDISPYSIGKDFLMSSNARVSFRASSTGGSIFQCNLTIGGSLVNNNGAMDALTSCNNCNAPNNRGKSSLVFTGEGELKMGNITTTGNAGPNNASWDLTFEEDSKIKCLGDVYLGGPTGGASPVPTTILVKKDGTLDLDTYAVLVTDNPPSNTRTFRIDAEGFLAMADQDGISTDGLSGAVLLSGTNTTRTYSPAATYIYKGADNQVTGNGLPNQATIRVDKTPGKTLTIPAGKPLKLDGIKGGTLVLGNNTLTIPNLVESGGDIDAASGTLVFTNDVALSIPSGSWTVNTLTRNNTSNVTLSGSFGLTLTGNMTGTGSLLFAEEAVLILENGGTESAPAPVPNLPYNQLSLRGVGKHYNLPSGLVIAQNLEVGAGATVNLPGGTTDVTINNGISLRGTLKGGSAPIVLCGDFILEEEGASYNPGSGGLVLNGCGQGGLPQKISKRAGDPTLSLGKVTMSSNEGIEFEFGEIGQTSGTIIVEDLEYTANGIIKIKKNFLKINGTLTGGGFGSTKFIAVEGNDKSAYGKLGRGIPTSSFESLNYLLFPIGRLDGTTSIYSPVEIAVESPKSNFEPLIGVGFYPSYPTSRCWAGNSLVPLEGESPVNHNYLQATWDISPEIIEEIAEWDKTTDKAYVKLLYQENGINETLIGGGLFIAHCFSSDVGPAYELLPANLDGNEYSFSLAPITEFSEFIIGQDENLMPVELLFFKSQLEGMHAKLQWATASEHQSDFFEVQRSSNGSTWETIGKVPAQGNSVVRKNYEWMDTNPYRGWSYYRLWQQDWDGSGSFYGPVSLQFGKASEVFEIYPTLVESELSLSRRSFTSELSYFLTDGRGNRLISGKFPSGNTSHSLSLAHLSTGLYFLHIQNGKEISNHKIYKK